MVLRQGGATSRHRVGKAGPVQGENIKVPLHNQGSAVMTHGITRLVKAIENFTLVIN